MAAVFHFAEGAAPAARLARALGGVASEVERRQFPDGESLVRVAPPAGTAILYRSLDNPNAKLIEILLAAAALRDAGAQRVVLVAPYLCYMRQDIAFHAGEAVSQRVIGALLADHFDAVVTVDPHLHRTCSLAEVVPGVPAIALSAASVLAQAINLDDRPVLAGPDSESAQWVQAIADAAGLEWMTGTKRRLGDRAVDVHFDAIARVAGRRVVLIDDVIASGETLAQAAGVLLAAGAAGVDAMATHCLATAADLARLRSAGIATIRATDTVVGPTADISIAGLLAEAIRERGWAGS